MGFGNAIVANDVPEHRETLGDAGRYYRGPDELAAALQLLLDDPAAREDVSDRAHRRAAELYGWDSVCDAYERWFTTLLAPGGGRPA